MIASILSSDRGRINGGQAGTYMDVLTAGVQHSRIRQWKGHSWTEAAYVSIFCPFRLCCVRLSVAAVDTSLSEYVSLAIGSCLTVVGFAIGSLCRGSLHPTVSFGISSPTDWVVARSSIALCTLSWGCLVVLVAGVFRATHVA